MAVRLFSTTLIFFTTLSFYGQYDALAQASQSEATDQIDHDCIGCICEAMLCNTSMTCNAKLCGPYRIMHEYWIDAGRPILQGDNVNDKNAYERCANDWTCAERTIRNYLTKFAQDCNGDGTINCQDYVSIHALGRFGCKTPLYTFARERFDRCQNQLVPVKENVNNPEDEEIVSYVDLQVPKKFINKPHK